MDVADIELDISSGSDGSGSQSLDRKFTQGTSKLQDEPRRKERRNTKRANTYAISITNAAGLESADFDLHESRQFIEHARSKTQRGRKQKGIFRWALLSLIGATTGLVGVAIDRGVHKFFDLREELLEAVKGNGLLVDYMAYVVPSMLLAGIAGCLVCYVEPLAAGSGIPEVKCHLNGVHLQRVVDFKTLLAKALGVMFSVSAGMPCGKEGPMIHSGAAIGGVLSNPLVAPLIRPYSTNVEIRDFVTAGAASGVAAAFGAPLGGVLFAMEEGATFFTPAIMLRTFCCCTSATLVIRFFLTGLDGSHSWGTMGAAAPLSFGIFPRSNWQLWELPIFALMGAVGGLCGASFNSTNKRLTRLRKRFIGSKGHRRFLEVLLVTLVISSLMFIGPVLSNGSTDHHAFTPTQKLFRSPGEVNIGNLFHSPDDFDSGLLLCFGILYYALAAWCYGLGLPSGLFVPSLLSGAVFGRLIGQLLAKPLGLGYQDPNKSDPGVYALMGATALLSGMARITISLAVILMEASGTVQWALPIFVTTMVAKWTGDLFTHGLYDIHIELNHVPLLEGQPSKNMLMLQAKNVMSKDPVTLAEVEPVRQVLAVLCRSAHHGFPVVDEAGKFVGMVKRETVAHVLWHGQSSGVFQDPEVELQDPAPFLPYDDNPPQHSMEELSRVLAPSMHMLLDLRPYANESCFTVPPHAALLRVHKLFRAMGLRHLPVVDRAGTTVGMITRKDLIIAGEHYDV